MLPVTNNLLIRKLLACFNEQNFNEKTNNEKNCYCKYNNYAAEEFFD